MQADLARGAFAGAASDGSGNRSPSNLGGDPSRTPCEGSGDMSIPRTWSDPVVGA